MRVIGKATSEYPRLLTQINGPPERLYLSGRLLDAAPMIAIVGSRHPTPYGLESARWFAGKLAECGLTIVSGMARGIDAAAHRGALESSGHTVAILGCGLDVCYPRSNRNLYGLILESGTAVSEYGPGVKALPYHFPTRNRIIAGMSIGVIIVEGKPNGGAMITARLANESGREVFAVPGPIHSSLSEGPIALIRDGARLVGSPEDVLEDLGLVDRSAAREQPALGPDESRILHSLGAEPLLLDTIALALKIPAASAAAVLSKLELKGLVTRYAGGRFAISVARGS